MLETAAIIAAISPFIKELLNPIAQNIGQKVGETLGAKTQNWVDEFMPNLSKTSPEYSDIAEQAKERYDREMLAYAKAKEARDWEVFRLTSAQTERRLRLQEQQDRIKLVALQRDLMRELQSKEIEVKLTEMQTIWDKDTWFSRLNREETRQILLSSQNRLLILLSPPEISQACPPSFHHNLRQEMRDIGTFLSEHYPQHELVRPVKFYGDYFTESIGDIDGPRLHQILAPIPTVILASDITDFAFSLRVWFWGSPNAEISSFPTKKWNWEKAKEALLVAGENETQALRIIRQLMVSIHKLLAAFLADLYYLNFQPYYQPQLFNLIPEFARDGLAQEWVNPYLDILKEIQGRQQEGLRGEILRLKASQWRCVNTLRGHLKGVNSVAISRDGEMLASGSSDKTIKLWNLKTGAEICTLSGHSHPVRSVAISQDGEMLASGSSDKTIKLWNPQTGEELFTITGHADKVFSVAISPDGKMLASGSFDSTIKLWSLENRQEIRTLTGHSGSVNSVGFSPDGQTLVSGSADHTIKCWNLKSGQNIRTLNGQSNVPLSVVVISPDGKTLVSGSGDKKIKIWNLESGEEIRQKDLLGLS